MTSDVCLTYLW